MSMTTNDKIKEVSDDFLLYYNDFIGDIEFADAFKHLAVNPDNPLVIEHMYHWLQHRLEALVREVREDERKQLQEKYTLVPKRSKREKAKDDAWGDLGNTLRNGV